MSPSDVKGSSHDDDDDDNDADDSGIPSNTDDENDRVVLNSWIIYYDYLMVVSVEQLFFIHCESAWNNVSLHVHASNAT